MSSDYCKSIGYRPGLLIDRINNNDGYRPGNIRFVTAKEQAHDDDGNPACLAQYLDDVGSEMEQRLAAHVADAPPARLVNEAA